MEKRLANAQSARASGQAAGSAEYCDHLERMLLWMSGLGPRPSDTEAMKRARAAISKQVERPTDGGDICLKKTGVQEDVAPKAEITVKNAPVTSKAPPAKAPPAGLQPWKHCACEPLTKAPPTLSPMAKEHDAQVPSFAAHCEGSQLGRPPENLEIFGAQLKML